MATKMIKGMEPKKDRNLRAGEKEERDKVQVKQKAMAKLDAPSTRVLLLKKRYWTGQTIHLNQ